MRKYLVFHYCDVQEALKLLETMGLNLDLAQEDSNGLVSKLANDDKAEVGA